MTVRFCSFKSRGTGGLLAAAALLGSCAAASHAAGPAAAVRSAVRPSSLVKIGEGTSPVRGLPSIKIEVPSPAGGAPVAEVGVSEKGVTVTTPILPKLEVPAPKVEVPAAKVEVPAPTAEVPSRTVPVNPPAALETVTKPSGGSGAGNEASAASAVAADLAASTVTAAPAATRRVSRAREPRANGSTGAPRHKRGWRRPPAGPGPAALGPAGAAAARGGGAAAAGT